MTSLKSWAKLRTFVVGSAILATGIVLAQNPGSGQPVKYYPSTFTQNPQNNVGTVRPPGGVTPGDSPARSMATSPPPGTVIPADRPRITTPVIAGPDGVRTVSAQEVELIRQGTPVVTPTPLAAPDLPVYSTPPTVVVEKPVPAAPLPTAPQPTFPVETTPKDVNRTFAPPATVPTAPTPTYTTPVQQPTYPTPILTAPSTPPVTPAPDYGTRSVPTTVPPSTSYSPTLPAPTMEPSAMLSPSTTPGMLPSTTTLPASIPTSGNLTAKISPNVSVEFEGPESASVGQPVTYTLVVKNVGTAPVMNVRIDEEIPSNCTYVSSEPISETANNSRLSWTIGNLDAGGEKRIKVTVKTTDEGEIKSRAAVTFAVAVETKIKVTRPKLNITMTGPDVVRVGDVVPLKVTIANVGTGMAHKIPLKAQFTEGLKYRNERGETIDGIIETEWANLPAGQSKSFTLQLTSVKPGAQQCVFSASSEAGAPESAKVSITLVEPQLLAKQTGPTKCLVRAEPAYQIELSNPGSATTDPVTAWTIIPEGFEFVQASDNGVFTPSNKAVMWKLAGMAAGSNKTLSVKLRSVLPATASIKTVVQSGAVEATDKAGVTPVAARNRVIEVRCETNVKSEGVPALRFDVVGLDGLVEVGKEAVYEIRVTNQGTGPCTNVTIEAELANGTTAVSATGATVGKPNGQKIIFEPIAQLGVRGEAVYKVRIKGTAPGDMRFRVNMSCDQVRSLTVKEEITRFYKDQ